MGSISRHAGRVPTQALLLAALLAVGPLLLAARPAAAAATFTVILLTDQADLDLSDDRCDVSASPGFQCTLRAAIQEANSTPGADTIRFDVPGSGTRTIRPGTELPPITGPTTVDGYSQPGARPNTAAVGTNAVLRIELNGVDAGDGADGLVVRGRDSVVRGLAINRFDRVGIRVEGTTATGVKVTGNFVGTSATGTLARPNGGGVFVDSGAASTTIGGTTPAQRNLLSGNFSSGISIGFAGGNNVVQGNLVGTTRADNVPLGNGGVGIGINRTDNTTVGGNVVGTPNTVAYNGGAGVAVEGTTATATGNRVLRNSIFANDGIGIDLGANGRTPNDAGDADAGANTRQNFPVLDAATTAGAQTTIEGGLNSTPNRTFFLRFFANPSGNEAKTYIGQTTVTTNAGGTAAFEFEPAQPVPEGHTVTSTATDGDGNTSELSVARQVT